MRRVPLFILLVVWLGNNIAAAGELPPVQTVFILMMENHSWSEIKNNPSAPYINNVLLPQASYCDNYLNLPGLHPSLPNYLWLVAGTNFGIYDDNDPEIDYLHTSNHLGVLLDNAGISWRLYQEHLNPAKLPFPADPGVAVRHNPFLYFDNVTCTNDPYCAYGLEHIRPYAEFARDLTNNLVGRYNLIVPDDCDDMHTICGLGDAVLQGDKWLEAEVPKILNSMAFKNNGALFIVFDETDSADTHIPFLLLSPFAWGGGYVGTRSYNHSSLLRTVQDIFHLQPYLGGAAAADNLTDLFIPTPRTTTTFQITQIKALGPGNFYLTVSGVDINTALVLESSTNLVNWDSVSINASPGTTCGIRVKDALGENRRFYRFRQVAL
jgi:hypothetical protein